MTTREDAVNEIINVIGILSKQLNDKNAWEDKDQEEDLKNRIAHLHNKTVIVKNTKIKKFNYDFNDLKLETTTPATTTTIKGKGEPQPIIWLGRGYMGDAND